VLPIVDKQKTDVQSHCVEIWQLLWKFVTDGYITVVLYYVTVSYMSCLSVVAYMSCSMIA
jgi:hypothetical protein